MTDRWTSDLLLTEQGVAAYREQIRRIFRDYADDFRTLAGEVRDDMIADPIDGDNAITARVHGWQMAGPLREMAKHAQAIVAAAAQLDGRYRRICVELPTKREKRTEAKELAKGRKSLPAAAPVNRIAQAATLAAPDASEQTAPAPAPVAATPFGDLFQDFPEAK